MKMKISLSVDLQIHVWCEAPEMWNREAGKNEASLLDYCCFIMEQKYFADVCFLLHLN